MYLWMSRQAHKMISQVVTCSHQRREDTGMASIVQSFGDHKSFGLEKTLLFFCVSLPDFQSLAPQSSHDWGQACSV